MLKKLLIAIAVLIVLLSIGSLFISNKYHIQRDIYIKAPASVVFDQINNLKNWNKWNTWLKMDPEMKITYNQIESGVGAQYQWTSKNKNVGNGSMTIVKSVTDKLVETELLFEGEGNAVNGFSIEPLKDSVKLSTYFDSDIGWNPFYKYMMLMFKGMMVDMTDNGLKAIKELSESLPAKQPSTYNIEQTDITTAIPYLAVRSKTGMENISQELGKSYAMIMEEIKKQKLEMSKTYAPFAIYYQWENNQFEFDAGIALDKPGKSSGNITTGEFKPGKYLMLRYFGDYAGTEKAHKALQEYAKVNNLTISGAPAEFYITDPMMEKDTAKWETDIYYPIGQ
jgi:effector-binding domain-containing protein